MVVFASYSPSALPSAAVIIQLTIDIQAAGLSAYRFASSTWPSFLCSFPPRFCLLSGFSEAVDLTSLSSASDWMPSASTNNSGVLL